MVGARATYQQASNSGHVRGAGTSAGRQGLRRPTRSVVRTVGRDIASEVPGPHCGWPVSAAGTAPRNHFSVTLML